MYIGSWTLVDKIYQPLCGMVTDTMADTSPESEATTQSWTSEWGTSIPTLPPLYDMVTGTIHRSSIGIQFAIHT